MADMTARLGPLELPNPVLTASGCSAAGRELHQFFDVVDARRRRHEVDHVAAAVGTADAAHGRDAERHAQLDRAAGPGHRVVHRQRPGLARRTRRAHGRLDRRIAHRRVRRAGAPAGRPPGRVDDRGQHLVPERREPRPGVRLRRDRLVARDRRGAPRGRPGPAGVRQALARRHRHHPDRARLRRRRRRRFLAHQHPARDGDRHRHDASRARWRDRRAERPGDPSGRGAVRLAGAQCLAAPADSRHGRHPHRARRAAVRPRRRCRGLGRHGGVRRSVRARPGARRTRAGARRARLRQPGRRGRLRAPRRTTRSW